MIRLGMIEKIDGKVRLIGDSKERYEKRVGKPAEKSNGKQIKLKRPLLIILSFEGWLRIERYSNWKRGPRIYRLASEITVFGEQGD